MGCCDVTSTRLRTKGIKYARRGGIYNGHFTFKLGGADSSSTKELSSGSKRKGTAQVHSDWIRPTSNARSTAGTFMILVRGGPLWRIIPVLTISDIGCDPNETSYKLNRLVSSIAV
jgi:hypothetical protein